MQVALIHKSHVYRRIEISLTVFEKGHPRNISLTLLQNPTSSFREEDFLRIPSCPYTASSPHSLEPCLLMVELEIIFCLKAFLPHELFVNADFKLFNAEKN